MPKAKAAVWDYFAKDARTGHAECTLRNKEYKTSGNTSNLRDHMKRYHGNVFFHEDRGQCEEVEDACTDAAGPSKPKQSKLHFFISDKGAKYGNQTEKIKKLDKELSLMIAKDM